MQIRKRQLSDRVYLLEFATQYDLAATFLRFQEYHESSRFKGRTFTLEEFMDWYAAGHGNFTYYQDWTGFNIPSAALKPFYEGKFDPLSRKERQLLDLFQGAEGEFYVIGVAEGTDLDDPQAFRHEMAHALFFTQPEYRRQVLACLKQYDTGELRRQIASMGYHASVLDDEVHAYLLTGGDGLDAKLPHALQPATKELQSLYRQFCRQSRVASRSAGVAT